MAFSSSRMDVAVTSGTGVLLSSSAATCWPKAAEARNASALAGSGMCG
jgi:hypothetical protein